MIKSDSEDDSFVPPSQPSKILKKKRSRREFQLDFELENVSDTPILELNVVEREKTFSSFKLRKIIRENHGGTIQCLAFNFKPYFGDRLGSNLLATCTKGQIAIYDNSHLGDNLDIVSHFSLNVNFTSVCWIQSPNHGPCLVAGDDKGKVHVISLVYSQEIAVIDTNVGSVISLLECRHSGEWLVLGQSLVHMTLEGIVKEWKSFSSSPTCMALGLDDSILIGHADGTISQKLFSNSSNISHFPKHSYPVRHIQVTPKHVVSQAANGEIFVHSGKQFNIPDVGIAKFDTSSDHLFLACGNKYGKIFIYNLESGKLVRTLEHSRSTKAIVDCKFSLNMETIVYGGEEALLWRMDRITSTMLKEWNDWKPSVNLVEPL